MAKFSCFHLIFLLLSWSEDVHSYSSSVWKTRTISSALPREKLKIQNEFSYVHSKKSSKLFAFTEMNEGEDSKDEESRTLSMKSKTDEENQRIQFRSKLSKFAKNVVLRPIVSAAPMPLAIASLIRDATVEAVDMAVDEVLSRARGGNDSTIHKDADFNYNTAIQVTDLIQEAFAPMEKSLIEMEESLARARIALQNAKAQATQAVQAVEAAALAQAKGTKAVAAAVEKEAAKIVMADLFDVSEDLQDISSLRYDEVGYDLSEMTPPFLAEDSCLVPGEAVVRVEKAPENSRRIYAGIDIPVSVEKVWSLLTDYTNLQNVVPNLTVNQVLKEYPGTPQDQIVIDTTLPPEQQCEEISKYLKGALLKQVGGAKVVGINFSARTTLEVREWPQGLPDFAQFQKDVLDGQSREDRALLMTTTKLQRYRFPRPFALSRLPSRDISMQSIEGDDGEFRLYQGVWRMQPLPGCAPPGQEAMRLTYAVEVSPRAYLPVSLVEGRIAKDMCTNLMAIREYVTSMESRNQATAIEALA
jgi:Polyketide cyclase / dehydrase and lipid transport